MTIRDATPEDAASLLEIYSSFVRDTSVSFENEPPSLEEFRSRIANAQTRWAWLVAAREGVVAGYAYATAFRTRAAYRWTAETSAYVGDGHRGKGVAKRLYAELLAALTRRGYCNAYAGITLPNEASVALHRSLGFRPVGVFRRAGWKFGKWHDVSWWQLELRETPPED